jgi:hypothetical protein
VLFAFCPGVFLVFGEWPSFHPDPWSKIFRFQAIVRSTFCTWICRTVGGRDVARHIIGSCNRRSYPSYRYVVEYKKFRYQGLAEKMLSWLAGWLCRYSYEFIH